MNIRRFAIVGVVGAVLLGATSIGAAASITNTVPKFGANVAAVSSCDNAVTTAWATAYDATLGAYEVTDVTVSALDGTACALATMKVTLTNAANAALGTEKTAAIASTDTSKVLSFAAENIAASAIANVAVVIVGP